MKQGGLFGNHSSDGGRDALSEIVDVENLEPYGYVQHRHTVAVEAGDGTLRYASRGLLRPPTARRFTAYFAPVLIRDVLQQLRSSGQLSFSCEFFPPKSPEGEATLWSTIDKLRPFSPSFVSVTYGAGGSTQDVSLGVTERIVHETAIPTLAHLTCVGASRTELGTTIERFAAAGIENILALRGDPTNGPGTPWVTAKGGFTFALELVEMLRERGGFSIGVAAFPEGHPESASLEQDARVLADKQRAGADFAVTNLFFSAHHYFDMVERAAAFGCDMPILPGLMPVTNFNQIARFAALSGAEFPPDLANKFESLKDDAEGIINLGIESTTALAEELIAGGAPGVHLYTLNRSRSTRDIFTNLGAGA